MWEVAEAAFAVIVGVLLGLVLFAVVMVALVVIGATLLRTWRALTGGGRESRS